VRTAANIVALTLAALGAGSCTRPAAVLEPVGTVREIMLVLDPAADAIWAAVGAEVTAEGTTEIVPQDEDAWLALETQAIALAEAGNLLMLPGRAVDQDEWVRRAAALRDAGRAALHAVRARDADEVLRVGETVTLSCDNCHRQYWDPDKALLH
jgi:hypothetical protein